MLSDDFADAPFDDVPFDGLLIDLEAHDHTETRMRETVLPHFQSKSLGKRDFSASGQLGEVFLLLEPMDGRQQIVRIRGLFLLTLAGTEALDGNALAALQRTALEDVAAGLGAHALPVTVHFAVLPLLRLVCPFRHISLILAKY